MQCAIKIDSKSFPVEKKGFPLLYTVKAKKENWPTIQQNMQIAFTGFVSSIQTSTPGTLILILSVIRPDDGGDGDFP